MSAHPGPHHARLSVALDFASHWELRGGVWRYGVELARALVQRWDSERVVVPCYDRLPEERLDELHATGARIFHRGLHVHLDRLQSMARQRGRWIPWNRIIPTLAGPGLQRRLFERPIQNVGVYHAIFTCRGRPPGGVTVGMVHDVIPLQFPEDSGIAADRFQAILRAQSDASELVIVPSEATKCELVQRQYFEPERLRVVHHGLDHEKFSPRGPLPDALLATHGLQPGKFLLYVGALERRKNVARLVRAYRRLPAMESTMPLALAGGSVHEFAELQASEGNGKVVRLGYVAEQDIPGLYRAARALVHVSLAEGFGFTPLEAMACGTPVMVSDHSAMAEVVGTAGLLVDPQDEECIAQGLSVLISDNQLRARLRQLGLERARDFTWEHCGQNTEAVYREAHERWLHKSREPGT